MFIVFLGLGHGLHAGGVGARSVGVAVAAVRDAGEVRAVRRRGGDPRRRMQQRPGMVSLMQICINRIKYGV